MVLVDSSDRVGGTVRLTGRGVSTHVSGGAVRLTGRGVSTHVLKHVSVLMRGRVVA